MKELVDEIEMVDSEIVMDDEMVDCERESLTIILECK